MPALHCTCRRAWFADLITWSMQNALNQNLCNLMGIAALSRFMIVLQISCSVCEQVIDAEMARRKLLEETPIDSLRSEPVVFDTAEIPWWAWVRRFHLPEVHFSDVSFLGSICRRCCHTPACVHQHALNLQTSHC